MRIWGTSPLISLAILLLASGTHALTQQNGPTIPVVNPSVTSCSGGNVQLCIDGEEGGRTFDVQTAAAITPETYQPACALTFRVIARGAGFDNTFGWYNVVPGAKPPDSDLHAFLECSDDVGTTKVLDIRSDPHYKGGKIGFFMASPEGISGNCPRFNPNGGPVPGTIGYIYYSEPQHNPDNIGAGSYIHLITYNSITHANSFYFAWEDLLSGGDNDFDDVLTRVEGIQCSGGGDPCDTGFDGKCSFGSMQCRNGVLECVQNETPGTEACNGVDDDCNGSVDDGDLCTGNEICFRGKCVGPCGGGEFTCPASLVCNGDRLCVDPACVDVQCAEGEVCSAGTCRGWCDGVTCPYGQVCRLGVCVDPCDGITCDADFYCQLGVCLIKCACGDCAPGLVCNESTQQCVDDGCIGVSCEVGSHCEGGSCVDDCQGATCPPGEGCVNGSCVPSETDGGTGGSGGEFFDGGLFDSGGSDGENGAAGSGSVGDGGGCGCRMPRKSAASGFVTAVFALFVTAWLRRRFTIRF